MWRRLVLVVALMMVAGEAAAHARLDRASPKVGGKVEASPTEVRIWFTDDVDDGQTAIEVYDAEGARVDKGDLKIDEKDKSIAVVSVKSLASGKYTVKWRARCHDGHATHGEFGFEVK